MRAQSYGYPRVVRSNWAKDFDRYIGGSLTPHDLTTLLVLGCLNNFVMHQRTITIMRTQSFGHLRVVSGNWAEDFGHKEGS